MVSINMRKSTKPGSLRVGVMLACLISLLVIGGITGVSRAYAQEIGDDVLLNGGFEQLSSGYPLHWGAMGGWTNSEIQLSDDEAYAGVNSIAIQTEQNTKPWIVQTVPYEAGATYEISTWLKGIDVQGAGVGFKLEYYKGQEIISENHLLEYDTIHSILSGSITGEWTKFSIQDIAPPEAGLVKIYLRLYGTGTVYFDKAAVVLAEAQTDD